MKKEKVESYVNSLIRTNGLYIATKITERCLNGAHPSNEGVLPNPPKGQPNVFFPQDRTGKSSKKALKERNKTFVFWQNVMNNLNKRKKVEA